jgi:putative ATP-dependent endonuclease of the OLD family
VFYAEITNDMARLVSLHLQNYRSIAGPLDIVLPDPGPLVLVGENNAGKSNIVKALNLLLGPFWPNNHEPEDNEFHGRTPAASIEITGRFADEELFGGRYHTLTWRFTAADEPPVFYKGAPGQYDRPFGFVSGSDRDSCTCVVLEADRNLRHQLSYASKWTFLSRLMHRFHTQLRHHPEIKADLETSFEQIKTTFNRIPEFQAFTQHLRDHFTSLVETMTHRLDVNFEAYNPANFFQALRLEASENGAPRALAEMGTGEQQVLAMAFAHAFARAFHGGIILVVEEPEAHLHPLAQQWLAQQLQDMCRDGLQIIITTHSAAFVDILNLDGIGVVRKHNGSTYVTQRTAQSLVDHCLQTGAPAVRTTAENILPFYKSNATPAILKGFFARVVVLVEGPTETLSLPTYFAKVGLDTAREGISIVGVQGKGNLAKWRRLFGLYGIPSYVIFDNDTSDDGAGMKRRDALRAVGIADEDVANAFIATDDWLIDDQYAIFGSHFEATLRLAIPAYAATEEQAAAAGVDSKPFKARFVAEHLEIDDATGWIQMRAISERVRALLGSAPPQRPAPVVAAEDPDMPF